MLLGILVAIAAIVVLALVAMIMYTAVTKHKSAYKKKPKKQEINIEREKSEEEKKEEASVPYKNLQTRFKAIGIFVAACFSILGVKIFSMQVLSGDKYTKESSANATTSLKTPAPRGNIFDRKGECIVKNRSSLTVLAEGDVVYDNDVLSRLSVVLGLPYNIIKKRIQDQSFGAQNRKVVASDVTQMQAAYISEHSLAFNGINIESRTVRDYPYGALAAHVVGYTGSVSDQELMEVKEGQNIEAGDVVGKSGVEAQYNSVLSGDHGERIVVSDADGNIVSVKSEIQPTKGSDVYLTIDAHVQYLADKLLAESIAPKGMIGTGTGSAGAAVVIDIKDGSVIALANYPTFKPGIFTNGISQDTWNLYNTEESYYPLMNRAISGSYPPASTFKAFTGLAGLKYHYAKDDSRWNCTGSWDGWNSGYVQQCWMKSGHGDINFRRGIVESCDVVFYEIGKLFYDNKASIGEEAMQNEIKKFNFGKLTGIDLDGEEMGRVPTPQWKSEHFKDVPTEASWVGGDTTNMAIGQGYVLVTPIQLAVAYASLATKKLIVPHVFKEVKNDKGAAVAKKEPEEAGTLDVDAELLDKINDALHGVATENASVANAFQALNISAAAKTGTAEVAGKRDFAWTACYGPFENPRYAISVVIEEGGGGADTATPMAAKLLDASIKAESGQYEEEIKFIAGSSGKSVKLAQASSSRQN
ncbi:MAG: penicillin-binding protein 2 [Coriobacteriia bacterium]|nr:penicillin-binding protein 2 [Coriobacteriia bacterium]